MMGRRSGQTRLAVILIVDDDEQFRSVARRVLERAHYVVHEAGDAVEADNLMSKLNPDLVLLDVVLPGDSGPEILSRWRATGLETPVIVLTGHGDAEREAAMLRAGADDYLAKPFSMSVLVARVANVLRRIERAMPPGDRVVAGPLRLLVRERLVIVGQRRVPLTRTETALLRELMRVPGVVRPYDELLLRVWGPVHVGQPDIVHTNVYRLRRKLEADPGDPLYIVATPGVGYSLRVDTHEGC